MKFKALLLLIVSFLSLTVVAQHAGGIEGTIVSRTTRMTIDNVKVTLLGSDITTVSDEKGKFYIHNLASGEYTLHFETAEYEDMDLPVRVEQSIREIRVVMIPANRVPMIDDAVFAEFDMEIMEDAQSLPSSLSASKDVFNNIASYQFSEMRFNVRGYDSQFSDVYMNGIQLNDAMTGYTPWSLWSGLNDATRNQEVTTGIEMGDMGIGGIAGVTNINTRPSQMRKGWRMSLVNSNSMYRFRGMLTYSSGVQDNGWSYAFSLSTRQGNNAYINGVYYNAYGYFAAVEKQFNPQHRLGLTVLGAPTERGAQMAATQEAYDLVGNNYYNPNWGWQDGKRRNARVRDYHEPLAMLNYTFDITDYIYSLGTILVSVIVIWLIGLWFAPKVLQTSSNAMSWKKALQIIGLGIIVPIVLALLTIIILLIPIASQFVLLLLCLLMILFFISTSVTIININDIICDKLKITQNMQKLGFLILSTLVFWLLTLIPYLGLVISFNSSIETSFSDNEKSNPKTEPK